MSTLNDNKMKEELKKFGLNEKEADVYLTLLKEKKATASKIAKLSKLNRTTAYLELDNLMKKGLINYVIKNSKRYYQPANPEKLLSILEEKKEFIKKILPELKSLTSEINPFKTEVYEGKEGIKIFSHLVMRS